MAPIDKNDKTLPNVQLNLSSNIIFKNINILSLFEFFTKLKAILY